MTLTIGSLFSGIIGGLEKGLESSGLGRVVWQVEQDQFCRTILAKHWPDADRSVCDVREATSAVLPRVDIICGGSPCPDFSAAGKGKGITGPRGRLIFAYERAVRALRPRAVVLENVASGKNRWLPHVRLFLETLGYRTRAIQVAAADVGAPHRRSRIFVLGLADAMRSRPQGAGERQAKLSDAPGCREALAHSDRVDVRLESRRGERQDRTDSALIGGAQPVAEPNMGRVSHGLPVGLDLPARWPAGQGAFQYDWEPPRTIPKGSDPHRRARLKALGNAVVPACGYVAGRALIEWMTEVQS